MTSNLADRLVSPVNEKNMKKAVLINSGTIQWCTYHFTKQDLHAGHTSFLLNSLVPSSSQKISFHVVKDIAQHILLISNL